MRTLALFFIPLILIYSNAQAQTTKKQICSHAWQQKPTSIIWSFKESGDFSAILFWSNKRNLGFTAKKGTYILDDSAKTLKVTFDSTYDVYSKDSFSIGKDIGFQEWHIVTITDYKIVISRPPVWEFEKSSTTNDNENILMTLDGTKKRKKHIKQQTSLELNYYKANAQQKYLQ